MPFNPDTATCPEETHPDADRELFQSHCFLEGLLNAVVKLANLHHREIGPFGIEAIMEAAQDAIYAQTERAVGELSETYPDTSATPEDWKDKLEAAAKEIAA